MTRKDTRTNRARVRTPEQMERNRVGAALRRKRKREEAGAQDREQWKAFVRRQAEARKAAAVQPSVVKRVRAVVQPNSKPGETVEQFMARGGRVDVLPGFAHKPGPIPARHYPGTGARAA